MSFAITSWLRAYFALQQRAMDSRGFVETVNLRTPRTLGDDVVAIAAVVDPYVRTAPLRFGGLAINERWSDIVERVVRHGLVAPRREFVHNREFWEVLAHLTVYLHTEGVSFPSAEEWDALLDDLSSETRNVGPKGDGPFKHFEAAQFDDLYLEQFKYLRDLRGSDNMEPDSGATGFLRPIPRSTNADVIALADYWSRQLDAARKVFNHDTVAKRWKAALTDVDALARKAEPNAVYAKNNAFWRALSEVAAQVAVADEAPTKADIAMASVKDSAVNLPGNLATGAKSLLGEIEDVVEGAGRAIGSVASSAGKGLFRGFGTPLLVGAGLIGMFLITRNRRSADTEV